MTQLNFLQQIQNQRDTIINHSVRESSLNKNEKYNIYNELDNIYSNDNYPVVNSVETQTDDYVLKLKNNVIKKKTPYCAIFSGSILITISLITINNFLCYYFTNIEFN